MQILLNDNSENDPYAKLGYGVVTYLKLIWYLILIFFAICCLSLIASIKYFASSGLSTSQWQSILNKASLGNLGFSSTSCHFIDINMNLPLSISCDKDT